MSTEAEPHLREDLDADTFGEGQHGATDRQYIVVAAVLAVITAMEVTITYVDIGPIFLPTLLILMAIKFLTVVSYFMHLKFDRKIFSFLFYTGLILAIGVYSAALATFHFFNP
jgi:cytochrome c oxidase subunit 4